ncbi:hypothetical protein AAC387_Pa01g0559 [Persea americana]
MTMVLDTGMPPFLGLEGGVDSESEKMKGLVSEGNWDSVLKLIEDDLVASNLILTPMKNSGDTLLHVAASEGQNEVVKIVRELLREELQDMPGNAFGNTPLHLAAGNGHAETCRLIIEVAPDLITKTNDDGLTPIFLAALTGYYDAFSALTSMRLDLDDAQIALKRGNGGDTILHCALTLENFDLASEIIKKFSQLIYCRNERGLTPLHILANNPSAFRSGCELGLLDRFFYESISVPTESKLIESSEKKKEDYSHKLAGNYLLCWTFFNLLWSLLWSALSALVAVRAVVGASRPVWPFGPFYISSPFAVRLGQTSKAWARSGPYYRELGQASILKSKRQLQSEPLHLLTYRFLLDFRVSLPKRGRENRSMYGHVKSCINFLTT